jgi:phage repressor protein C with HTH and peptisase S24 domain
MHPSAERLYAAAAKLGDTSTGAIAKRMNLSVQTVQNWETRGVSRDGALLAQLTYGDDANWLLGTSGDRREFAVAESPSQYVYVPETRPGYVRFPLLEGFAGMGRGDYMGDYPEVVDFVEVTREWALQKLRGVPLEMIRVITGRGDSMKGQYNDGDLVFVDARVKQFLGDSAYCYRWNGQVQIKRLQLIGKGLVRILSENPKYPPIDVPVGELEIGGMAVAAWTLKEF